MGMVQILSFTLNSFELSAGPPRAAPALGMPLE
jgi:hypothetical protein